MEFEDNFTETHNFSYDFGITTVDLVGAYKFQFIMYSIIIPLISLFGLVGNVLTLVTLCKKSIHPTVSTLMFGLVITDLFIILLSILTMTMLSFSLHYPHLSFFLDVIYPYIFSICNFLIMASQQGNVWITVMIAVERYIALCHPFFATRLRTMRNVRIAISLILLLSLAYNLPRYFATHAKFVGVNAFNQTHYAIEMTEFGRSKFYTTIYMIWMYAVIVYIIPILLLSFLSISTVTQLLRMIRKKDYRHRNSTSTTESDLTICMVSVVVLFILCQTPGILVQIRNLFDAAVSIKLLSVSNMLFILNSSVNFFIYTAAGTKFRRTFVKILVTTFCGYKTYKLQRQTQYFNLRPMTIRFKPIYAERSIESKCQDW